MKWLPAWIRLNPVLPWGVLFLLLSLTVTQYGGLNALARTAGMRAITKSYSSHRQLQGIDNRLVAFAEWSFLSE